MVTEINTLDPAAVIDALKRDAGAATDSELASLLGVQRSAVAQWRRRGRVPEKARLKVRFLANAREQQHAAMERAGVLSAEVLIYGRALALSVVAPFTGPFTKQPEFEALWFRRAALLFDQNALAAAEIIEIAMRRVEGTAWDAYQSLLGRAELRIEIAARAGTSFAAIDV